jgi:hypothetical protein
MIIRLHLRRARVIARSVGQDKSHVLALAQKANNPVHRFVLLGPPAFAREACEGCRAGARRAEAGRALRYGSAAKVSAAAPSTRRGRD